MTVIGVVRDFHFRPLNEKIGPELFAIEHPSDNLQFNIRVSPLNIPRTLAFIGKTFKKLAPDYPFSYMFRKDRNLHAYDAERLLRRERFAALRVRYIISVRRTAGARCVSRQSRRADDRQ